MSWHITRAPRRFERRHDPVQNHSMRWSVSLCLVLLANAVAAEEPLGPMDYLKILTDSKLHYNLLSNPSKTPVGNFECPRRDESLRVVRDGD